MGRRGEGESQNKASSPVQLRGSTNTRWKGERKRTLAKIRNETKRTAEESTHSEPCSEQRRMDGKVLCCRYTTEDSRKSIQVRDRGQDPEGVELKNV